MGRDRRYDMYGLHRHHFNPRAPCGARLPPALVGCLADLFQSTRPVWGATSSAMPSTRTMMISIHAPRVGRDKRNDKQRHHCKNFNPRAPCGARRRLRAVHAGPHTHFNPRAPCGARPKIVAFYGLNDEFQSTRPVWGATIAGWFFLLNPEPISIHAPRVGRDRGIVVPAVLFEVISIHAPRVGRDFAGCSNQRRSGNFNPRAPCGARRYQSWP